MPGANSATRQPCAVWQHVDHGQLGDDAVDNATAGVWQRAVLDDLGCAVTRDVLHHDAGRNERSALGGAALGWIVGILRRIGGFGLKNV
jgi:hypothetical protein